MSEFKSYPITFVRNGTQFVPIEPRSRYYFKPANIKIITSKDSMNTGEVSFHITRKTGKVETLNAEVMHRIGGSFVLQPTELLSVSISNVYFGNPVVNAVKKFLGYSLPDVIVVINGNYGSDKK